MYIPYDETNITPYVDYNQWLNRLDTQHNEPRVNEREKVIKRWGLV